MPTSRCATATRSMGSPTSSSPSGDRVRALTIALAVAAVAACDGEAPQQPVAPPAAAPAPHRLAGPTMGSSYEVLWHGDADPAAVRAAVDAELAATDASFSAWRADSELSRCNAH